MLSTERLELKVVFDHEGAVETLRQRHQSLVSVGKGETYTKDTNEDEESYFKEMPISLKVNLEQDKFSCPVRIHSL